MTIEILEEGEKSKTTVYGLNTADLILVKTLRIKSGIWRDKWLPAYKVVVNRLGEPNIYVFQEDLGRYLEFLTAKKEM